MEANKWSLITAPVSGQSIKEFVENTANNIRVNTTVTPNRYAVAYYDDNKPDGTKWTYYTTTDLIDNTITFEEGKGYIISRTTNGSVTFTGNLTTTNSTVHVNGDQWNAVGNPYTAFLPINNNGNDNFIQENLDKFDPAYVAVYVWNTTQNKYVPKTLVDSPTSLTVAQGFFIKTKTGVSSIDFKEEQRLSNASEVQIFSRGINKPSIQIVASQEDLTISTDIKYVSNATKGLDPGYDIGNFGRTSFDIFTHLVENSEGKDFTLQSLPNSALKETIIPIGIKSEANKTIEIAVKSEFLPSDTTVYLEDKETGKFVLLNEDTTTYSFKTKTALSGIGRFYVHTKASTLSTNDDVLTSNTINIYKSDKQEVTITGITSVNKAHVQIVSVLGNEVYSKSFVTKNEIIIEPQLLEVGIYIVRLKTDKGMISKKLLFKK